MQLQIIRVATAAKILALFLVAILAGCAAGGVDGRMASTPATTVVIDNLPVDVRVLKVVDKPNLYDVEAQDGRSVAFTDINQPLVYLSRFKEAAEIVLRQQHGKNAKITQVAEYAPTGFIKIFVRYSVVPQ